MRRSAAPSQLAKRARFAPPFKTPQFSHGVSCQSTSATSESIEGFLNEKSESSPVVSPALPSPSKASRRSKDILALFNETEEAPQLMVSTTNDAAHQFNNGHPNDDALLNNVNNSSAEPNPTSLSATSGAHFKSTFSNTHQGKENCFLSNAPAGNEQNNVSEERYFSVVWCKRSTRKHKKWEGDAILIVKTRSVILKDTEGKTMGQSSGYKSADLSSLDDGNTLVVGNKEIEIQGIISASDYNSGRCFLSAAGPSIVPADVAIIAPPRTKPKPFKLPTLAGSAASSARPAGEQGPLYSVNYPHSLIFPRPSLRQQFGAAGSMVDVVLDPILSSKLRPHQRDGVIFLYKCVTGLLKVADCEGMGCILADEMGLGKTLQCIALLWTLLKQNPWPNTKGGVVKRALIIAPSSLVTNWGKEFHKWLGKKRISVFTVDQNNRVEHFFLQTLSPVLIVSYDMFMRSHELFSSRQSFDILICDEAHRLKNSSSKTTSLLAALPIKRRVLLTGTPLQNDLQELYALTNFAIPGVLSSCAAFKRVYEEPIIQSRQIAATEEERVIGASRLEELNRITSQFILRRTQDIINKYLPPKVECVVFCNASVSQIELYSRAAQKVRSHIFNTMSGGEDHLSAICLLRKLCNHPALLSTEKTVSAATSEGINSLAVEVAALLPPYLQHSDSLTYSEEDSGKLAVLSCLLHQLHTEGRERVVVVSNFTSTLDMIEQLCNTYSYTYLRLDGSTPQLKRQQLVDNFNGAFCSQRVFLLSARAGGVGLNLIGASRIVLYDIDWNPATDLQAMARVWRDGQTRPVYIYRLLLSGSVEERMFQRQVHKQGLSGAVVDAKEQSGLGSSSSGSSNSKVAFSQEELKDLFNSNAVEASECITHTQLKCSCDLKGSLAAAEEEKTYSRRDCQLNAGIKSSGSTTMDQLYKWQHIGHSSITEGCLKDSCLELAADFINMVFRNECTGSSS